MYLTQRGQNLSGLGLSLKLPSWLRNDIQRATGQVVDSARQAATDVVNSARARAAAAAKPPGSSPIDQVNDAVSNIPGGWVTIGAVGLGLLLIFKRRG